MVYRIVFIIVSVMSSALLLSYKSAKTEIEDCVDVQFLLKYQMNVNGFDLYYFLLDNDTVLIAGRSDSIPIAGLQAGEVELLQRKKYRLPISYESSSDFLFQEGVSLKFPLARGNHFYYGSEYVFIPKLIRVFSTNHINGGFINYRQCE